MKDVTNTQFWPHLRFQLNNVSLIEGVNPTLTNFDQSRDSSVSDLKNRKLCC